MRLSLWRVAPRSLSWGRSPPIQLLSRGCWHLRAPLAEPLLKQVGRTLVSTVGGAAGPLYGTFFLRMAVAAGDAEILDGATFARALRAGLQGVAARGKTAAGDKTMYDAPAPAVEAMEQGLLRCAGRTASAETVSPASLGRGRVRLLPRYDDGAG